MIMRFLILLTGVLLSGPLESSTKNEKTCLALNIYHEARGEGRIGQLLVGHVTLNRVEHENWPNNICQVVYQPNQFSWTRSKNHKIDDQKSWEKIKELSSLLLRRNFDRSNGALYYINDNKVDKRNHSWLKNLKVVKVHNNHKFFTLDLNRHRNY